jgi:hypothetical protein
MLLLTGCTPHPGIGEWVSPGANADDIYRLKVFINSHAETYNSTSQEPITQCDWKSVNEQSIEINCVYPASPKYTENYKLTVTAKDEAELYKADRLLTRLVRQKPQAK